VEKRLPFLALFRFMENDHLLPRQARDKHQERSC